MFPYDGALLAATNAAPASISDVLQTMNIISSICVDGDGLKWFNWLYLQVTSAVENRVATGGFRDPAWLSSLDVQFAGLYFKALNASLRGDLSPGCWSALFSVRDRAEVARIQFALAGMNAHINHDLPLAITATCHAAGIAPQHGTDQYADYTGLNAAMNALIDQAKATLNVRLLGDKLPAGSRLEDSIAAWNLAAAREKAWITAESLWQQPPALRSAYIDIIDGLTTVIGKVLLVPVPKSQL